jgi:hypothetical protein
VVSLEFEELWISRCFLGGYEKVIAVTWAKWPGERMWGEDWWFICCKWGV